MSSQTSLLAEQVRLRQWAAQIQECQSRPADMEIETWRSGHSITQKSYYYRLRRVGRSTEFLQAGLYREGWNRIAG